MDYGRSLVHNRLMHATDLEYGDCAELQVVCPACSSPLHKRGSQYSRLQYLAHYSSPNAVCELRVRHIVRMELQRAFVVTVPSAENLLEFLIKFEEIVMERWPSSAQKLLQSTWNEMRQRSCYRAILFQARSSFSDLVEMVVSSLPLEPEQLEPAIQTVRYLTAPNTFRAMMFAVSYGAILHHIADDVPQHVVSVPISNPLNINNLVATLVEMTDLKLKQWWSTLKVDQRKDAIAVMIFLLCNTAVNFIDAVSVRR